MAEVRAVEGGGRPKPWWAAARRRLTSVWWIEWRPATWSWSTPGWPSPASGRARHEHRADRLSLSLHRVAGAPRRPAAGRTGRLGAGQNGGEPGGAGGDARGLRTPASACGESHGGPLPGGRPAVGVWQRRQRHRRRGDGRPVPEPAPGAAPAPGHIAGRRPRRPHRAGQRRGLRPGVLPADHRPRPGRRYRRGLLHQRRLRQRTPGPRGGLAAGGF